MADHFQNQYGAVPAVSQDPIQKEMDAAGDITGIGSTEHVAAADVDTGPALVDTTTTTDPTGEILVTSSDDTLPGSDEKDHHKKKGIMEKIKEKLPGKHNNHNNN